MGLTDFVIDVAKDAAKDKITDKIVDTAEDKIVGAEDENEHHSFLGSLFRFVFTFICGDRYRYSIFYRIHTNYWSCYRICIVHYNNDNSIPQQKGLLHALLGMAGITLCYIFSGYKFRHINTKHVNTSILPI